MMNKVKTSEEALKVFDLLGVKEVTKEWQKKKGTRVFELPFKTMYAGGSMEINRFSIYHSGYVRKMCVAPNGASRSCWQLNKQYKSKRKYFNSYYKEYRTFDTYKRAMIYNHEDRYIFLCNYILKNYYRNQKNVSFYRMNNYQVNLMKEYSKDSDELDKMKRPERYDDLPFKDDVQVIINGHRYKLS